MLWLTGLVVGISLPSIFKQTIPIMVEYIRWTKSTLGSLNLISQKIYFFMKNNLRIILHSSFKGLIQKICLIEKVEDLCEINCKHQNISNRWMKKKSYHGWQQYNLPRKKVFEKFSETICTQNFTILKSISGSKALQEKLHHVSKEQVSCSQVSPVCTNICAFSSYWHVWN